MSRFVSGFFSSDDPARPRDQASVRVFGADRRALGRAVLLELGLVELRLAGIPLPPLESKLIIAITIPDRFIEFEVPGVVAWHEADELGVHLGHLSARQAYGVALVRELRQSQQRAVKAEPKRAARPARG